MFDECTKDQSTIKVGDFVGDYNISWDIEVYPCVVLQKDPVRGLRVCEAFCRVSNQIRWLDEWVLYDKELQAKLHNDLKTRHEAPPNVIRDVIRVILSKLNV